MKNAESAIFSWKERIKSLRTGRGVLKIFRTGFTDFEGGGRGEGRYLCWGKGTGWGSVPHYMPCRLSELSKKVNGMVFAKQISSEYLCFLPPGLGPGLQPSIFIYRSLPSICILHPWPPIYFYGT